MFADPLASKSIHMMNFYGYFMWKLVESQMVPISGIQ